MAMILTAARWTKEFHNGVSCSGSPSPSEPSFSMASFSGITSPIPPDPPVLPPFCMVDADVKIGLTCVFVLGRLGDAGAEATAKSCSIFGSYNGRPDKKQVELLAIFVVDLLSK